MVNTTPVSALRDVPATTTEATTTPATSTGTTPATTTPAATTQSLTDAQKASVSSTAQSGVYVTPENTPGATLTTQQMKDLQAVNADRITNPTLPDAAKVTPTLMTEKQNELLTGQTVDPNALKAETSTINASQAAVSTAADPTKTAAATYTASTIDPAVLNSATTAVTAALPANALVSNQLASLLTPDANGNLPAWVSPAVTKATQFMSARGMDSSTMAGQAITAAILTAAIPVATANANAELAAFQQNLSNQQAAAMQNGAAEIQGYFTNQAAENAAKNFNSTSENQTNQFFASLATNVNEFNATQRNSIAEFNATKTQDAETQNATLRATLSQFNATMSDQREKFNVNNAMIIEQANTEWRRQINTSNTELINQANQINAANALGISNAAYTNMWQQFSDEATMLFNAGQTAAEQNYSIAYLAQQYALQGQLNQQIADINQEQAQADAAGNFVGNLFSTGANAYLNSSSSYSPTIHWNDGTVSTGAA